MLIMILMLRISKMKRLTLILSRIFQKLNSEILKSLFYLGEILFSILLMLLEY